MWKKTHPTPAPTSSQGSAWHAVSITSSRPYCKAAHALSTFRFLSAEAPRLPLAQCPIPHTCACTYKHHADRRKAPRRELEVTGLRRQAYTGPERRTTQTRRKNDEL
jgi:hypothetical protein